MTDRELFPPIGDGTSGEVAASAPMPEVESAPDIAESFTPEELERGYRRTQWNGLPNFECILAPFASLRETEVQAFVARLRARR